MWGVLVGLYIVVIIYPFIEEWQQKRVLRRSIRCPGAKTQYLDLAIPRRFCECKYNHALLHERSADHCTRLCPFHSKNNRVAFGPSLAGCLNVGCFIFSQCAA
jgi:hypothetical protein